MGNWKLDGEYCKYNIYFVYLFESPNLIFLPSKKRLEQVSPKKKFKKNMEERCQTTLCDLQKKVYAVL